MNTIGNLIKTPSEFQKHYHLQLVDTDLAFNLERILQGVLDRDGVIAAEYGMSHDDGIDDNWFIDLEDSSFWYPTFEERNKDIRLLTEIINEFRKANNLKCDNPVWML